jgi:hypothetical protein
VSAGALQILPVTLEGFGHCWHLAANTYLSAAQGLLGL